MLNANLLANLLFTRARGFAELLLLHAASSFGLLLLRRSCCCFMLLHAASSFGLLLLRRVLVGTIGCIWLRFALHELLPMTFTDLSCFG